MSDSTISDREEAVIDLLKIDYDATQRNLTGFVATAGQLRAVGIAVWGVLNGAALTTESWPVAVVAAFVLLAFVVADGYYSSLYRQALRRSRKLEGLLAEYHKANGVQRRNTRRLKRAMARIEQREHGAHLSMGPVNTEKYWWLPRPLRVAAIYPLLLLVGLGIAVALVVARGAGETSCENGASQGHSCLVFTTPGQTTTVTKTTRSPTHTVTVPATTTPPPAPTPP